MIAVKLCCLNIIQVGSSPSPPTLPHPRIRILLNSIPYSQISKGQSVYMCINQQSDLIELEWPRQSTLIKRFIPRQCIQASTIAAAPFWMEFDANPHFVRVQLKMVLLSRNRQNREKERMRSERCKGEIESELFKVQQYKSINCYDQQYESQMKGSSMSMAFCMESERTLNDLESQRQKILESLFNKIKSSG